MKKCDQCGYISKDSNAFCTNCGNRLAPSDDFLASDVKICSSCGTTVNNSATHCNNCGYAFKTPSHQQSSLAATPPTAHIPEPPTPQTYVTPPTEYNSGTTAYVTPPKKKSNPALWIILIILIVAVVAASAFLVYKLTNKDNSEPSIFDITTPTGDLNGDSEEEPSAEGEGEVTPPKTEKISDYYVYVSDITWEEANSAAKQRGGDLVSVTSEEEFNKVCQLANDNNLIAFWLGMKRTSDNKSWYNSVWHDGSNFDYDPWFPGEPTYTDEHGNQERYLMAFKVEGVWYFNDSVNDVSEFYRGKIGYIVEKVTEVTVEE